MSTVMVLQLTFITIDTVWDFAVERHVFNPEQRAVVHQRRLTKTVSTASLLGVPSMDVRAGWPGEVPSSNPCPFIRFLTEQPARLDDASVIVSTPVDVPSASPANAEQALRPITLLAFAPKHSPPAA